MATMSSSNGSSKLAGSKEHDISVGSENDGEDLSNFVALNLLMQRNLSMALQAVLNLGIPDILAEGGKPMSPEEILQQLPTKSTPAGPSTVSNLHRLLRPLVRVGFFSESLDGDKQLVYGLTGVSKWFIRGSQSNLVAFADLYFSPVLLAGEPFVHEVIIDETTSAFEQAHGVSPYVFDKDPGFPVLIQKGMESFSNVFCREAMETLQQPGVLDGVHTLVDVGGSHGHVIAAIVARNPQIQGINFDLPHVVAKAPAIKGVQHVGGNFFDSVPSGDAMFLKWVIHNYPDEEAIKILQSCFKALPTKNGKVILAEFVYNKHEKGTRAASLEYLDLQMLSVFQGSQERSKEQYQTLLAAAGFSHTNFIDSTPRATTLIEGVKE
ncbi:unnamed protein product [Calypogeia fissa]